MFRIHLSDETNVNTTLAMSRLVPKPKTTQEQTKTVRLLKSDKTHEDLAAELGTNYAQALIDGNPEYTIGMTGMLFEKLERVWLADGQPRYTPPVELELIRDKTGKETDRRPPKDVLANIASDKPLQWRGDPISRAEAMREYVFRRTLQIQHKDGLTYRFCHAMAERLDRDDQMVQIKGGEDGRQPLVLAKNGKAHWGLLEGRVRGSEYQLLLHLSFMQLRAG